LKRYIDNRRDGLKTVAKEKSWRYPTNFKLINFSVANRVFEIEDIECDVNAKLFWSEQKAQNFSTEFNLA